MANSDQDYCYVYLDFSEKLTPSLFAKKMFLRVANLHKPHPLVQLNDLVFKGSYDECVGTNLFFEEIEDPPLKTNIFEKDTPIRLKPLTSQTKIIKLKKAKLPRSSTSNKRCKESAVLNLNQDYAAVLDKLAQGVLNIDDVAEKKAEPSSNDRFEEMSFEGNEDPSTEPEKEIETFLGQPTLLEAKYEKLKRLARRPVKRMKSPELVEECEPRYREAYEYHNLERQVCQSSDAFRSVCGPIIEKNFVGGVDIDRCVLHGIIAPSADLYRELTRDERNKVFTIDNFENLSIPARYLVMKECVAQVEELMESTPAEELKEVDENGRTIKDVCDIFRRLANALEECMAGESEDVCVKDRTELTERASEDYVKYRYDGSEILLKSYEEMFRSEEWTDEESARPDRQEEKVISESDDEEQMFI